MSDKVICQEMDVGNSGTPVTIVNEMPATDLNNEMPVSTDDMKIVKTAMLLTATRTHRGRRELCRMYTHHDRKELDTRKM